MRPDQVNKIERALAKAYGLVAGDNVIHVSAAGVQTPLVTIEQDTTVQVPQQERGLAIDAAGMLSHGVREIVLLKSDLAAHSVEISPTCHFLIDGERWDLVKDSPIEKAIVPLAGIQNMVRVRVRKAVELGASQTGAEFSYEDD